jgi:thioredoxin reductase
MNSSEHYDALIVGGSYAGMSAALQLVRARRNVLVIDAGAPRNRNAVAAHGFLGREGMAPSAIAAQARAELMAYPTLTWREGRVVQAAVVEQGRRFQIACEDGQVSWANRLVLAYGVTDTLPECDADATCGTRLAGTRI